MTFNAPHNVTDEAKLQSMIATLKNGGQLPPVIVCGNDAFTGSHRLAAWEVCEMDAQAIVLSDSEFILAQAAMNGVDDLDVNDPGDMEFYHNHLSTEIYDYNDFCEALFKITNNADIKNAVKDQF